MSSQRRRLLQLLVCGLGMTGISSGIAQRVTELRHQVLTTWTTAQGLPQDFVTAIQQTPDGFLWIGTNGGLARFDGLHFRTFLRDGPAALRHRINALKVDREGTLWIGTSAGFFRYRDGEFGEVVLGDRRSQQIEKIVVSVKESSVLIRTKEALYRVDNSGTRTITLPFALTQVRDFALDRDATEWFTDGKQITELQHERVVQQFPLPNISLLYAASDGRVFAGDGHNLFILTRDAFVSTSKQGAEEFVDLLLDREGSLWMASGGLQGVSRFRNGKVEMLDIQGGLASNDARVLFEDRSGDIWIGTISGLQHLHRGTFISYTDRDGLPPGHNQYDAIFEDKAGSIWAGGLESGIVQWDANSWKSYGVTQGVRRGQVRGFAEDRQRPVFAMADYGLFSFVNGSYRKVPGTPDGYVSSPVRTSDGSLWFSVLRKGIFRLKNGLLTSYGASEGMTDNVIWSLVADSDGGLWAGAQSGAFHWDGMRWKLEIPTASAVNSIALARNGGIFLGTSNGLLYRNASMSWSLTQENGLPGDAVFSMAEDLTGALWLGTARGICRIPVPQLATLAAGAKSITPEVFTEDDGLQSRTVLPIGQVTGLRAHDGRIWFATASGPAVANPDPVAAAAPTAVLDDVIVDEEHYNPASPLTLRPGRHRLTFNFTAPTFVAPEQVHFRYRLPGWDNTWVNAGEAREASYVGLPPGQYRFEVQALGRTGEPGSVSAAASVVLQPFFWQTRLFLLLVVVVLVATVIEVTRRRTLRRAEALNLRFQERAAERERLASHIHDTFIQDLTGTALQLELLGLQMDEDPEVARLSLNTLAARMREMIGRSRDIVSNLHSMAGTQHSLLELLSEVETEFRLGDTPEYVLESTGEPKPLHPFLRDEVYSICREAVANAFRHAQAHRIEVHVDFLPTRLLVRVEDDGSGMTEDVRTRGRAGHFGLSGMLAHARRIDAVLEVQSSPGAGTRVSLEIPLPAKQRAWLRLGSRALRRGSRFRKNIFDRQIP